MKQVTINLNSPEAPFTIDGKGASAVWVLDKDNNTVATLKIGSDGVIVLEGKNLYHSSETPIARKAPRTRRRVKPCGCL